MIILSKKKILLAISTVFISLFVFLLSANNNSETDDYISTVSLPVSGKVVVVDAGHGVPDEWGFELKL